ncbi:MAG: hypothetical protein AB7T06_42590 [Kofleriaceae bacterium]
MFEWLQELLSPALHGDRVRDRIAAQPVLPIAEVQDGARACIVGKVEAIGNLVSPMTNQPCAGWFISIEETGMGDHRFAGAIACHGEMLVRDDSGSALVVFENARFAWPASITDEWPSGLVTRAKWTPTERDAFERSKARLNYPTTSGVRFREHAILAGARVYVYGHAQREPDRSRVDADEIGYRGDAPTRPVFSGTRKIPLMLADTIRRRIRRT